MRLISFVKQDKDCAAFLQSLKRIISKGSNKKGVLFIEIKPKFGKITIYKGFIADNLACLGSIISKAQYQLIIDIMDSLSIRQADESVLPDIFQNKRDCIYYILNSIDQERFQL